MWTVWTGWCTRSRSRRRAASAAGSSTRRGRTWRPRCTCPRTRTSRGPCARCSTTGSRPPRARWHTSTAATTREAPDMRYDAFLLVSFGGPEGPDDVMPFLRNVTRGRGVPEARLAEVAEHYLYFGGVSPINAQCRELLDAIGKDFAAHGLDTPLYWGNRNWDPYLADTVRAMR